MARIARVVCPHTPHLVIQRGNRRQKVFFGPEDYRAYIDLMAEWCQRCGVEIWAYGLMPNHVQLIAVPQEESSLARAIGEAHRRYTRMINFRRRWRGHLWQERFGSFPMDGAYTLAAAQCIEMNPVKARLAKYPTQYRWSSARAHMRGEDDDLVTTGPLLDMAGDWKTFLGRAVEREVVRQLELHQRSGRPLGQDAFIKEVERATGRLLRKMKTGPKPRKRS